MTDITPQIVFSAATFALAVLTAWGTARYTNGKNEQRLTHLEKIGEQRDEVLHERINKMQAETAHVLEKLDVRSIQMIEKMGELKGMIAMANHGKGE